MATISEMTVRGNIRQIMDKQARHLLDAACTHEELFDGSGTNNYEVSETGEFQTHTGYYMSSYIKVEPGETYLVYPTRNEMLTIGIYPGQNQSAIEVSHDTTITIPEGGNYVVFSFWGTYKDEASFEHITMQDKYARDIIGYISDSTNIIPQTGTDNYTIYDDGSFHSKQGDFLYSFIDVLPGQVYETNLTGADDVCIGVYQARMGTVGLVTHDSLVVIPANCYVMAISSKSSSRTGATLRLVTAKDSIARESIGVTIECGAGKPYTTLKSAISAARDYHNAKVFVYPGTYNLVNEFATEIAAAQGEAGLLLTNGMHVFFYDGAKVTAVFSNDQSTYSSDQWRWIYDHFQPFYTDGDFVLENLDIEAANTRYCVHDELSGQGTYVHKYINCRMKYTNEHSDISYVQCIGGGLGQHGTIVVDGGYYESQTLYAPSGLTPEEFQIPISYHNGSNSSADSSITIKDVYLADKGYFRFGYYGSSTIKSPVSVCGCSMNSAIVVGPENSSAQTVNFELTEWNNIIRA